MPLSPKRKPLESELKGILGNPNVPLTGQKLAKALSNFSKGILPPTIGIFTGIGPATAAYEAVSRQPNGVTKGIESAVNTFASFNASGMSPFAFTGIAPPPIFGLQRLFDFVRRNNGTVEDIAKLLSRAILINYTLGKSVFNPLNIPIPTWNIPILPGAVRDEMDQDKIDAKMAKAAAQEDTVEQISSWRAGPDGILGTDDDRTGPEQEDFFERMRQPE